MDLSALSASLSPETIVAPAPLARDATPNVQAEQTTTIGADFQNVLEGFRKRASSVEATGKDLLAKPGEAMSAQDRSMRQLTELYTYAVDLQLMVRTGGQLTSGMRQLVTGQ
jgi:hypothetical protein